MAGLVRFQRQPHDHIQVGFGQTPYSKNGSCVLDVLKDQVRRLNRAGAILLKQRVVLWMALLDMLDALIGDDDFSGLQCSKKRPAEGQGQEDPVIKML